MTYLFNRVYVISSLMLIASISHAFGEVDCSSTYEETDNCMCCQPVCCGQGYISADLLYWRPFVSGLSTCVTDETSDIVLPNGQITSRFKGSEENPHFRWDPGFRINAGYEFACSNWDVAESWIHFHSHAQGPDHNENKVRWVIDLDIFDAVAGYEYDLSPCFALRPFVGLRAARINQKLRIDEISCETGSCTVANRLITYVNNNEKFIGVGPLMGLQLDWSIGCGFDFFVGASVSWLYGNYNVKLKDSVVTADVVDICQIRQRLNASLASADFGLGIRWRKCLCNNRTLILQIGLEHHRYFDYNRIGSYGDLSFDGVNFGAGIEF